MAERKTIEKLERVTPDKSDYHKKCGWLKNEARRKRREGFDKFTDEHCRHLIDVIEGMEHYISPKLPERYDILMRSRDKALISMNYIFFKRANEQLRVKRSDVVVRDGSLFVTFIISKTQKRAKFCPVCDRIRGKNKKNAKFCNNCATDLTGIEPELVGEAKKSTKWKSLQYKFAKYITDWLQKFDEIAPNHKKDNSPWLFPPLSVSFESAFFKFFQKKPMTVRNYNYLLQKLDESLTTSLFRYGGSERCLRLGYTPEELKELGDWSTIEMPMRYAKEIGLTREQKKFGDDLR